MWSDGTGLKSRPQDDEVVNPPVFPWFTTTCAKSVLAEGKQPDDAKPLRTITTVDNRCVYRGLYY